MPRQRWIGTLIVLALVALVAYGQWRIAAGRADSSIALVHHPRGVMGTECVLAVVVAQRDAARATQAFRQAEAVLRSVEARMSNWLHDSEISRLGAAEAGREFPLSPATRQVLGAAREAFDSTGGTFDVTCQPQLELWRRAAQVGSLPSDREKAAARSASRWELIQLTEVGIVKHAPSVAVDLGGIAKGYAIDEALQALRQAGVRGGLVEIGGDLACFGRQADGQPWRADVKHPSRPGSLARLRILGGAVATSGDYARYLEIGGRRYSHIVDPRTCQPTDGAQSVTVAAPTALIADIWATALSILGPDGLARLPGGVEALIVIDGPDGERRECSAGFRLLLEHEI